MMIKHDPKHHYRLSAMVSPNQQICDLSPADVNAIRWALDMLAGWEKFHDEMMDNVEAKAEGLFVSIKRLRERNEVVK